MAKKRPSSKQWLNRQQNDPFVKQAQKEGLRSRASFKLRDIQERYHVIKKGNVAMDLGSAPGSWSMEMIQWVGDFGQVIACDLLPMPAIGQVHFIQGDFTELAIQKQLKSLLVRPLDVVVSDMSPNFLGISKADQWAIINLNETALAFCQQHLKKGGHLVMKCFMGDGIDDLVKAMRQSFTKVHMHKPASSRKESNEFFAVCLGFKGALQDNP